MFITFLITLVIIGVILYLLNTLVPMDQKIKTVINVVVLVLVFFYALVSFGVIPAHSFPGFKGMFN